MKTIASHSQTASLCHLFDLYLQLVESQNIRVPLKYQKPIHQFPNSHLRQSEQSVGNPAMGRNFVWSHPAFAEKRMFARNDKELIGIDLAEISSFYNRWSFLNSLEYRQMKTKNYGEAEHNPFVHLPDRNPTPLSTTMRTAFTIITLFFSGPILLCKASEVADLESTIADLVANEQILGAQLFVGKNDKILLERNFGIRSADDSSPIDFDTQFCIGSCSKPFASAVTLALTQEKHLNLDTPISVALPEFKFLEIKDHGSTGRSPTLRELLSHRGGIYSQKVGMNRRQTKWIRDFKLTLEDAVSGIAKESLISVPGTDFAYSGAGYCIIGRVAEAAMDQSFEDIFQTKIGQPLNLHRTTFFPNPSDPNIATGSSNEELHPATPHLSEPFNLPLIGGSLYSTARDSSRFARMVIGKGCLGEVEILSETAFKDYSRLHFDGKSYGLGWSLKTQNRKTVELSHTGALAASRAAFRINLKSGMYVVALYTLTEPSVSADTGQRLAKAISAVTSSEG
jgi:CubicO group peptidase (beta-lactamase class C family)